MSLDHLNYFFPYRNKKAEWEDSLTRAFLLLVKYVPAVQQLFVDLLRDKQQDWPKEQRLPSFFQDGLELELDCQTSSIRNDSGQLFSVCLADEAVSCADPLRIADRERAIYDGILYLGQEITILIEDKPSAGNVWRDQLNPSKSSLEGKELTLVGHPLGVAWAEILDRLNVLCKRDYLAFAEKALLDDFLEFIDHSPRFRHLKPYKSLAVCGEDLHLLNKRCRNLLEELGQVNHHRGWKSYLECRGLCRMVALSAVQQGDAVELVLEMHPGNTIAMAKSLYEKLQLEPLLALETKGWSIQPNFHFADSFKQFFWSKTSLPAQDYLSYWKSHQGEIRQYGREHFTSLLESFLQAQMITAEEHGRLTQSLLNSGRNVLRVIPGLSMTYHWPLSQAVMLDQKGELRAQLSQLISAAFAAWQQSSTSIVPKVPEA